MRTFGHMSAGKPIRREAILWLLRTRWRYRWALRCVVLLAFVALCADFIANEKPIYCVYEDNTYFPAVSSYGVKNGWTQWPEAFHRGEWHTLDYQRVLRAPIPYSSRFLDLSNVRYKGPFQEQNVKSWYFRHWLGTDALGRDVLAGMIYGTRAALLVGLLGTALALIIGLIAGGWSGYYGDERWKTGPWRLICGIIALVLGGFYGFYLPQIYQWEGVSSIFSSLIIAGIWLYLGGLLGRWLDRLWRKKTYRLPFDLIIMRFIEAVQAMPGMLLLLALIPLFLQPSIWNVVLIVGLIRWPTMARFIRAELLRIRELPYIEAASLSGIPHHRILWRHAMPNAIQPLLVVVAFSISSGVLLEAFLSFLGLGVPPDQVTWGSLLQAARNQFQAWWLAIFPGLGIFLTVTSFNLIGEAIQEWLDNRAPFLPENG